MYIKIFPVVVLLLLAACAAPTFSSSDMDAIRSTISQQEKAWNNGDIPSFMQAYDDSACFISLKERTCGKSVVTARYEKRYPDREAMGTLDFGQLEILGAGADHAWCTGTWRWRSARRAWGVGQWRGKGRSVGSAAGGRRP